MKRSGPIKRTKPLRRINRERIKKLRAQQFGADGKREWIMAMRCPVSGKRPPSDPAHVLGTRGAGYGPEGMCPLARRVHVDFDSSMTDERFAQRWGKTRDRIKQLARDLEHEWQLRKTTPRRAE